MVCIALHLLPIGVYMYASSKRRVGLHGVITHWELHNFNFIDF